MESKPLRPTDPSAFTQRYFAYGRNMHVEMMAERCPAAQFEHLALLPDHRILINHRGVSTVVHDPGHLVHGVVWQLTAECEVTLDRIEGVVNGHYTREQAIPHHHEHGAIGSTLIYHATGIEPGPPKAGYLEALMEAADHHNFPKTYRDHLASLRHP